MVTHDTKSTKNVIRLKLDKDRQLKLEDLLTKWTFAEKAFMLRMLNAYSGSLQDYVTRAKDLLAKKEQAEFHNLGDKRIFSDSFARYQATGTWNPEAAWKKIFSQEMTRDEHVYLTHLLTKEVDQVYVPKKLESLFEKIFNAYIKKEFLTTSSLDICPTDVRGCEYPSQEWCNVDPCGRNCVYYFGMLGVGSSCDVCPSGATCTEYVNKEYCSLDPCRLGCSWEETTDTCYGIEVGQDFDWPTDTREVFDCQDMKVQLSPYDRTVKAIASGKVVEGRKDYVEIDHGNGYKSHYINLQGNRRARGNVQQGETIGFASRGTQFYITKDDTEINIFEHYDKQKIKPLSVALNKNVGDCPAARYATTSTEDEVSS